jgi:hypothetical protein
MPGIASSVTGSTSSTGRRLSASRQTTRAPDQVWATAGDGGRPRAPKAVKAAGRESGSGWPDASQGASPSQASVCGLVIYAKSVRDAVEGGVNAELLAADALGLRFPRSDLVASAAALFEPAQPWAHGPDRRGEEPDSGRFRITVGPGVVRLGWTNPVRAEKASERAVNRHRLDVAAEVDHIKAGRDVSNPPGRAITEWSRKSRAAMCRTFAELDYTPLVECGRVPAMVTLTYPAAGNPLRLTGPA